MSEANNGPVRDARSPKIYLVARREYVDNIRTKAFWIGILVFPILITAMMVVPSWLERAKGLRKYAVVDHSGWLLEEVEQRAAMPDLEQVFASAFEAYRAGGSELESLPEELRTVGMSIDRGMRVVEEQQPDVDREQLEEQMVGGFASVVAGLSGTEGERLRKLLPEEAVAGLDRLRESIQDWWQALPPKEAEKYGSGLAKSRYQRVDVGDDPEALGRMVADGDLFAVFVIGEDPVAGNEGSRYISANLTDDDLNRWFSRLAGEAVRDRRLAARNIDSETAEWIQEPVRFAASKIGAGGQEEKVETQDLIRQWAPTAFVYLLWIAVFSVSQMLLSNTIEEKSNRLMEVLLSSVTPLQLMVGKIAGIAATGLTMLTTWLCFFFLATRYVPLIFHVELGFDLSVIATDPVYIASFVAYFFLGYLFYASLLVGIGSVCNSLKEAQNLMTPITLLLFVPLIAMVPISQDPNGTLAKVLSFIPTFTPFAMMNRAAGPPSVMEYVLTSLLMVASVAFVMWAAAKVFRVGVLMTGKRPQLREILRWVRAPVGVVHEHE